MRPGWSAGERGATTHLQQVGVPGAAHRALERSDDGTAAYRVVELAAREHPQQLRAGGDSAVAAQRCVERFVHVDKPCRSLRDIESPCG